MTGAPPELSEPANLEPTDVVCEDGREYSASHVIVTSSLGYLKENHRTLFHPSLPIDIGKAIDIMGFDTINKLFLVYDNAWWPEDFQGIQLIWNCEEKEDADHQVNFYTLYLNEQLPLFKVAPDVLLGRYNHQCKTFTICL
ncbi:hypothetical protein J6590_001767 [Homalodisca vitripennis]|nr:hypothetical protein J6590_001767 [Homalodisca vitripennis]